MDSNGLVVSSYWDLNSSGQSTSVRGIGLTTSQMHNASNFAGWNFSTVWNSNNVSRPWLR